MLDEIRSAIVVTALKNSLLGATIHNIKMIIK